MKETTSSSEKLGTMPIGKLLATMSIPVIFSMLVQSLYNVVDSIFVSQIGEDALTAVSLAFPLQMLIIAFALGVAVGVNSLIARKLSEGNKDAASQTASTGIFLAIINAILFLLMGLFFTKFFMQMFSNDATIVDMGTSYLSIVLIFSFGVFVEIACSRILQATGNMIIPMISQLIGAITNIILDPIFIFGFNMGVQGAALATVISQILSAIWIIKFLTGKKALLKLKVTCFKLKKERVKKIVGLGLSGFIMAITNGAVQIVCNASLQFYGGDLYVGVMTIINTVRELVTMPVLGVTNSAQPVIGYNYGAKAYSRVKIAIKFMSGACILYTLVAWAVVHGFPAFFIQIFNHDEAIIQAGIPAMKIYFFGFFMMALQFAGQSVFVGLGKSKQAIFFSLFRKAIIVIPLTLILPRLFGLNIAGVFMAEPISNFIGGAACFITMLMLIWPELNQNKTLQQNI